MPNGGLDVIENIFAFQNASQSDRANHVAIRKTKL